MELEAENNNGGDRVKTAELEHMLTVEKLSRSLLESESVLAKLAASQESSRTILEQVHCTMRERELSNQARVKGLQEEMAALERAKTDEVLEWKGKYGKVEAQALTLLVEKQKSAAEITRLKEKNLKLAEAMEEYKRKSVDLGHAMGLIEEDVRGWVKNHGGAEARASKIAGDIAGLVKAQTGMKEEEGMGSPIPLVSVMPGEEMPNEAAGSAPSGNGHAVVTPAGQKRKSLKDFSFDVPPPKRSPRRSQQ